MGPGGAGAPRGARDEETRTHPNPNYDFSFPVELAGRPGLQINWNRGDDPNMVAIQFCDDNGIPRDQLGDVAVFVQNVMASQS